MNEDDELGELTGDKDGKPEMTHRQSVSTDRPSVMCQITHHQSV